MHTCIHLLSPAVLRAKTCSALHRIKVHEQSLNHRQQFTFGSADQRDPAFGDRVNARWIHPEGKAAGDRPSVHSQRYAWFAATVEVVGQACHGSLGIAQRIIYPAKNRIENLRPGLINLIWLAKTLRLLAVVTLLCSWLTAFAQQISNPGDQQTLSRQTETDDQRSPLQMFQENLERKFPQVQGALVEPSFQNFYKVTKGTEVGFVSADLRYLIRGEVFDLDKGTSLSTLAKVPANQVEGKAPLAAQKVDISNLPTSDAIRFGTGKRKLYVFSDPDCPFCKSYELVLARAHDVSIYVFPFPLEMLHPQARAVSEQIWCRAPEQRAQAWRNYVLHGQIPSKSAKGTKGQRGCSTPIESNIQLGASLGITGTPATIFENGTLHMGAMDDKRLNFFLTTAHASSNGEKK